MRVAVPDELAGERVDLVVARLGGISRSAARLLVDSGGVLVDGSPATAKERLAPGAVVEFDPPPPPAALAAEPVAFGVIYEDDDMAVVDKPAGIVTHPGAGTPGGTLAGGILHRWPKVRGVGEDDRWGIVHRLDRDTSGALLVALSLEAYAGLREALRERRVTRRYLALVHGTPVASTGTIDAPIGSDSRRRGRRRVNRDGRPAVTHYRLLASAGGMSLLEVKLETGRTHQIRVHLASVDLPVAGDRLYGRPVGSPRQFLHAASITFDHPLSGESLTVASPLPDDLAEVLAGLGLDEAPGISPVEPGLA